MSVNVTMPQLGENVTEGTVTRWLKQVGDMVADGEPIVEVATDKVDTEIPAPASGVLVSIAAAEDDVVAVGAELAVIGAADQMSAQPPAPASAAPASDAPTVITLPELGESVTEGTVIRWLKSVGDTVEVDEPLVEISTDKVDTEIPSPVAGTLLQIVAAQDEVVEVGGAIGVVGSASALQSPASVPVSGAGVGASGVRLEAAGPTKGPGTGTAGGPPPAGSAPDAGPATDTSPAYVTPLVRKLAADHGVDLGSVVGTGIGGRIRRQDVLAAAGVGSQQPTTASPGQTGARVQRPPSRPAPTTPDAPKPTAADLRGRTEKMSNLRRLIAERMVESLQVSAQLTTVSEVDLSRIAALRSRVKERFESHEGVKLSYLPFFAKAAVEALKSHPSLNASVDMAEGEITYHDFEHLGIAVDTKRGLLAPVIRDAGDLNIAGLARHIANLAERTRTNRVSPDELSGATFTLTNTGSRGSLIDTPIINQPQVAILATGAVVKRPVVVQGSDGGDLMAIRSMAYLALTYDHRVIDGADAARFMSAIKRRLEEGEFEGELGL